MWKYSYSAQLDWGLAELGKTNDDSEKKVDDELKHLYNIVFMSIIEEHIDKEHTAHMENPKDEKYELKCNICGYETNTESDLKVHVQTLHRSLKVNIESQNMIKCTECPYICKYNIQLKQAGAELGQAQLKLGLDLTSTSCQTPVQSDSPVQVSRTRS